MKFALWAIVATLMVGSNMIPNLAEAKSVKWSCVILDPLNPSSYTCTPVNRP